MKKLLITLFIGTLFVSPGLLKAQIRLQVCPVAEGKWDKKKEKDIDEARRYVETFVKKFFEANVIWLDCDTVYAEDECEYRVAISKNIPQRLLALRNSDGAVPPSVVDTMLITISYEIAHSAAERTRHRTGEFIGALIVTGIAENVAEIENVFFDPAQYLKMDKVVIAAFPEGGFDTARRRIQKWVAVRNKKTESVVAQQTK